MEMTMQPDPLEAALAGELRRGERVLWKGRQLRRFNWGSLGVYLFAIPWTAFAVFWTYMAAYGVSQGGFEGGGIIAWAFPAFGLPFVAVGLLMLAAPFIAYYAQGHTIFAVTDQRLVRITAAGRIRSKSVEPERIGEFERSEAPDGTGTLTIAIAAARPVGKARREPGFRLGEVEHVRMAEDAVRQLAQSARRQLSS